MLYKRDKPIAHHNNPKGIPSLFLRTGAITVKNAYV
jgi:hypothetical protein